HAKVMLPHAINNDAGGQWIVGINQPLSQAQPAPRRLLARRWKFRLAFHQYCRDSRLHDVAGMSGRAAQKDMRNRWRGRWLSPDVGLRQIGSCLNQRLDATLNLSRS